MKQLYVNEQKKSPYNTICIFLTFTLSVFLTLPSKTFSLAESPRAPSPTPEATPNHPAIGEWLYYGYFYNDHFFPPNDPNLKLTFEFRKNGDYRLYWTRTKDGSDFCEALGIFEIKEDKIHTEIHWVNPKNHMSCSSDPDMREGRKASTPFEFHTEKDELNLFLPLADSFLIYALKRISSPHQDSPSK